MTPACHRIYNIRSLSRYLTHAPLLFRTTRLVASTQTTNLKWSTTRTQGRSFTDSTGPEAPRNPTEHVVVLGGGITGLATAFHLSRRIPQAKITLVENQDRVGGWIRSERVELGPGKGHMILEAGPRTLRPQSQALLELIHLLGLEPDLITTSKTSAAARNRFLYLPPPDGKGLTALPFTPSSIFTSPFLPLLAPSVLLELLRPPNRTLPVPVSPDKREEMSHRMKVYDDESVDEFLSRRFGRKVARVLGTAIVHGIWAADSRELSVRASFPSLWDVEERGWGGVMRGILRGLPRTLAEGERYEVGELLHRLKGVSVFSFRHGMESLPKRLLGRLRECPNVQVSLGTAVKSLQPGGPEIGVQLANGATFRASRVVSTIPLPKLHDLIPPSSPLPHLKRNSYSSVTVVNFIFDSPPSTLHPAGFGYLVPRPANDYTLDPSAWMGILGTVFDSSSLSSQDSTHGKEYTKLTMMCGGPWGADAVPSVETLLDRLFEHLRKPRIDPVEVRVHQNMECIPTPRVGHLDRMKELRDVLKGEQWGGRLAIVGAGVDGPAVPNCVEAARRAAVEISEL